MLTTQGNSNFTKSRDQFESGLDRVYRYAFRIGGLKIHREAKKPSVNIRTCRSCSKSVVMLGMRLPKHLTISEFTSMTAQNRTGDVATARIAYFTFKNIRVGLDRINIFKVSCGLLINLSRAKGKKDPTVTKPSSPRLKSGGTCWQSRPRMLSLQLAEFAVRDHRSHPLPPHLQDRGIENTDASGCSRGRIYQRLRAIPPRQYPLQLRLVPLQHEAGWDECRTRSPTYHR